MKAIEPMADRMDVKMIVVGATGVIGTAVARALDPVGTVLRVARSGGDAHVDARSPVELKAFFERVGAFDHLISLVGARLPMGALGDLSPADMRLAFEDKVQSQIQLVQAGLNYVRDHGSFTLSSGFLNREPMPGFSAIAMANGALEGFVKAAALEMERGVRINSVSPVFVQESLHLAGMTDMTRFVTMSAADTALAYVAAVEGDYNGFNLDPRAFVKA
jgi:NAD(P)-dependent dehydrogenase (short-subunit alcohol dehydrogenase family)